MDKRHLDEAAALDDQELVSVAERVFLEMDKLEEPQFDEVQVAAQYAGFGDEDRNLAEEGIEDYQRGLLVEDAE